MNGRIKTSVRAAIDIPKLQDISGDRGAYCDVQFAASHSKIPLHDFGVSDTGMNDQNQINMSVPFDVCLGQFVRANFISWNGRGGFDSRYDHIPEFAVLTVKDPGVPT